MFKHIYNFNLIIIYLVLGLVGVLSSCKSAQTDSVTQAETQNKKKPELVSSENAKFLVEMTDARMMDYAEGKLAAERGTTKAVREYGAKMMTDQNTLLKEIRDLAQSSEVVLPTQIGADKEDGLKDLQKLQGRAFDKKFLSMIQIDHERDVQKFAQQDTENKYANDEKVVQYKHERLPLIEEHLADVKKIRRKY